MTTTARLAALGVGIAGLLVAAAALAREVVLAAEPTAVWPTAGWWSHLSDQPVWQTAVASAAAAALAAGLIFLAVRQIVPAGRDAGSVELAGERGRASLSVAALERSLLRRLQTELSGITARRLTLRESGARWRARLEGDLVLRDLAALQRRATAIVAADLLRMGGLELEALDIVAVKATPAPAASRTQKEDLGITRSS